MLAQLNRDTHVSARVAGTNTTRSTAYRWPLVKEKKPVDTEWIAMADLRQWLGGSTGSLRTQVGACASHDAMAVARLDLACGDVLYAQGSVGQYVYVVASGLVQCHSQHGGLGFPVLVSYAGAREWLGLHDHVGRRQASVNAVAATVVYALPVGELRALSASSPVMAELLARQTSMALKRDWRVAYSLRDLPPYTRTVVGLTQLVRQIDPDIENDQHEAHVRGALNVALFGNWLGLPLRDLHQSLTQLQRYGALRFEGGNITDLTPQVLFSASRAMSYLTNGRYVPEPVFPQEDPFEDECVWEDAS